MSSPLRGVVAPILTPFNPDLSIATDLFVDHARRLLRMGCAGLAPFGTTGEALSVGIAERRATLDALLAGGVEAARLIPGTGLTDLPGTAELCRDAVDRGCAGVMVLPPFYYKAVPDDGLYGYYARLIDWVGRDGLKLYLYHIPQVAGVGLPVDVVARLHADFPGIVVGIKDSSGDWANTAALFGIEGLIVYPGSELPLLDALDLGGPGCISATANLNAGGIAEVVRRFDAGDRAGAAALHGEIAAFRRLVQDYGPIPAQKGLLALTTGDDRWAMVRPPLVAQPGTVSRELAGRLKGELKVDLAALLGMAEPAASA
ncbi:MAG: dihydrodipicolinate synthase family protein [Rhodospirillaceae bacterium]|nr:dihydrodipicolinate synthase family protein [Rhodospirillaceae bacterium]